MTSKPEFRLVRTHGIGAFGRYQLMEVYTFEGTTQYLPIHICDLKFDSIEEAEDFQSAVTLALTKPVIDITDDEGII